MGRKVIFRRDSIGWVLIVLGPGGSISVGGLSLRRCLSIAWQMRRTVWLVVR